ncbi:MAG: response regulator [Deltaproteobacteria bacterium]|nr:response regulator [Deltaproteobacteria bacterium]
MITTTGKNILLADDNQLFREKLRGLLHDAGHYVVATFDGMGILNELTKNPTSYNLLIMDMKLPHVDGLSILNWMKRKGLHESLTTICMSENTASDNYTESTVKELGAKKLINKELTHSEVLSEVNSALFTKVLRVDKSQRVPVSLTSRFKLGMGIHEGSILNISTKGIFLKTSRLLPKGSFLKVQFDLPGISTGSLTARCEVMWQTPENFMTSRFFGVGLMFRNLQEKEVEKIGRFVDLKLRSDIPG